MIFLDTNVVSETLKREPEPRVLRWLTEHDAELALPKWLSELHESVLINAHPDSARLWNSSVASGQHQPLDVGARGVVDAERVALVRVQRALQQGAEDGRLDLGPLRAGVALGLAAGAQQGVVEALAGAGADALALADEGAAAIQVDAAGGGAAVTVAEGDAALEDVGVVAGLGAGRLGARQVQQFGQLGQEQLVVGQLAAAGAGPAAQEAEALIALLCRPRGPRPQNLCDAAVSMVRFAGAAAPCAGLAPEVRSGPCRLPLSAAMRTAVGHV